ncbi:MAG: hypothetical protein JXO72_09040 [Vicinamibacteria bacterium]|nr:hypothetical protein [Vicinamibacteria bacterium]
MSASVPGNRFAGEERAFASDLLRVDYESERLRIGLGQIGGAWQIPLELARRASRAGARTISVRFEGSRLIVVDDGHGMKRETAAALAELLDPLTQPEARHRALVRLEKKRELGFLALSAAGARRVRIHASGGGTAVDLAWEKGGRPRIMENAAVDERTVIEIDSPWNRSAVRAALHERCRFVPATVTIDGCAAPKGFRDAFATARLHSPLTGALALVPRSPARVLLLLDGVIAARTTLPDGPSCEAAVEMRPWIGGRCAPASLREAFREHEETILKQATELILGRARSIRAVAEPERRLIRRELMTLARRRVVPREALTATILPAVTSDGERWLSLLDLGRQGSLIEAIFPDQDRERFVLSSEPALILDADERALLGELLDVGFRTPPERPRDTRRLVRRVRSALHAVHDSVSALIGARVLSDSVTAPQDREALRRLRAQPPDSIRDVELCAGRGRARRVGDTLLIPRGNVVWRAGRSVIVQDPAWLYPLYAALWESRAAPAGSVRRRWRERESAWRAADRSGQS